MAAIGAVFDFYAGTKKRSSDFWITIGLEWLPRLLKEPKRLWERNLKSTPIFLWWMLKAEVRGRRSEVSRQKQGRRKNQTNDGELIF
ncbi:MAG: WecB/TagA/CpsF family glycosyltransferase [Proteobacteria bacterium]|nr:WecB/TagA/CpsF family glycosyltransferase [Pseudomonadota bacterium]MBU4259849.1 WecB/TagA/CpsF family glycosyltransferase [Pseudomonadota bacterium]MBU4288351.1 WecB/TagA/CpsF family glycosyltransferase [Pseudomonadota bacterium]